MGRQATGRSTLADVARHAGVSPSTASLAFSGSPRVSDETRARITVAAEELGYGGPDPVARSLRRGRCGVVAVLVGERLGYAFRDPMMVQLLDGLSEEVGQLGASLMLVPGEGAVPAPGPERVASLPMDAAVFSDCGHASQELVAMLRRRGVPVVGVDESPGEGVALVDIDDEGATAGLVDHLVGLGHRSLGVVALPLLLDGRRGPLGGEELEKRLAAVRGVAQRRIEGIRSALADRPDVRVSIVETASNVVEEGERAAAGLLDGWGGTPAADGGSRPTALLAQSDVLALGCLRAAAARGLDVPGDVSVAGFDGVDLHIVDGTEITTVVQPAVEKGRVAGRHVVALLGGERLPDVRLPVHLRVGTTSGPPPARQPQV